MDHQNIARGKTYPTWVAWPPFGPELYDIFSRCASPKSTMMDMNKACDVLQHAWHMLEIPCLTIILGGCYSSYEKDKLASLYMGATALIYTAGKTYIERKDTELFRTKAQKKISSDIPVAYSGIDTGIEKQP